jgi:hypothetical protein
MSKGNTIIVSTEPRGRKFEGIVSGTPAPGTLMEPVPATEPIGGRFTFRFYQPSADGDPRPVIVLLDDSLQGFLMTTAYVTGTEAFLYCPIVGELLNMLVRDIAGTGDSHAIGDRFQGGHADGKLVVQSTSANASIFTCMETAAAPVADVILLCMRA